MKRIFRPGPRAREILQMYREGLRVVDIARQLGCSPPNVSATIKHYGQWRGDIDPLTPEQHEWLVAEAKKARVPAAAMARALLVDAINDAMEKSR